MNRKAEFLAIGIIVVLAGAVVAYSTNVLPFNAINMSTGNETQTQSAPLEQCAQEKNLQQEAVLTPLQESLQESIEKLKSEGRPHPQVTFNSTTKIPADEEITASIQSEGSFEATILATTTIEYDGPQEAGKERWDDIIVADPEPAAATTANGNDPGVLVRGNLTQQVIDEHPEIYGEGEGRYQYGEEPRTFVVDEAMVITFVESEDAAGQLHEVTSGTEAGIGNVTEISNTVMGFSFVPKKIDYTINPKVKVLFITLAEARAGFFLDMAFGLRLPVQVNVTHPESMVAGQDYVLETSLTPIDFSAEDYANLGLPPEKGQEFFSRFEVFAGLKVWVIGIPIIDFAIDSRIDLGKECTGVTGSDCQNFVTPFGVDETGVPRELPIPELRLDPDDTGLEYSLFGIITLGMGLIIDPEFGSDKISAEWSTEGYASGKGDVVYAAASPSKYPVGPVEASVNFNNGTFIAQENGASAVITLDKYKFHLNRQLLTLYGNLQLELLGVDVAETGYIELLAFNFTKMFGEPVIGQHKGIAGIATAIPVQGNVTEREPENEVNTISIDDVLFQGSGKWLSRDSSPYVNISLERSPYQGDDWRPATSITVIGTIQGELVGGQPVILEVYRPDGRLNGTYVLYEDTDERAFAGGPRIDTIPGPNGTHFYRHKHITIGYDNVDDALASANHIWTVVASYGQASDEQSFEVALSRANDTKEIQRQIFEIGRGVVGVSVNATHVRVTLADIETARYVPEEIEGRQVVKEVTGAICYAIVYKNDTNPCEEAWERLSSKEYVEARLLEIDGITSVSFSDSEIQIFYEDERALPAIPDVIGPRNVVVERSETDPASNLIEGTDGDDILNGTGGPDEIGAKAGNDIVHGLGSDDRLFGDDGDDEIYATGGGDPEFNYIEGGAGSDMIKLSQTSGEIYGGRDDDDIEVIADAGMHDPALISGGGGNDHILVFDLVAEIYGDEGDDEVHARGEAHHVVYGGLGGDELYLETDIGGELRGGAGDDYLESELFDGHLYGGAGDDVLNGPGGDSDDPNGGERAWGYATLTGGPGADNFICSPDAFEEITDYNPSEGDTLVNERACDEY